MHDIRTRRQREPLRIVHLRHVPHRHRGPILQALREIVVQRDRRLRTHQVRKRVAHAIDRSALHSRIERWHRRIRGSRRSGQHHRRNQQRAHRQERENRRRLPRASMSTCREFFFLFFCDRPRFLIVLIAQRLCGGQTRLFAMLGGAVLLVHHGPEEPDLFPAQKAEHLPISTTPILSATSQDRAVLSKDNLGTWNLSPMGSKV